MIWTSTFGATKKTEIGITIGNMLVALLKTAAVGIPIAVVFIYIKVKIQVHFLNKRIDAWWAEAQKRIERDRSGKREG